jgi:hypothetical protein
VTGPIDLGSSPPALELDPAPGPAVARLSAALAAPTGSRRDAVADVVRAFPAWSEAWADLGDLARDDVEAYACFRVGYHRGLDALRRSGWKGSGYVRWTHEPNRGFLRCVDGLRLSAAAIGEADEAERCEVFMRQLDPSWATARLARGDRR